MEIYWCPSLTLKENTISNIFTIYILRNTYPKGRALMKMYRVVSITVNETHTHICFFTK